MTRTRWNGKVALVTGASAGIGAAVARELSGLGLKVVLTARRLDRLKSLAEEIRRAGGEALTVEADLTHEDDISRLFKVIREAWDGVDVLINNAGLGRVAPLMSGETTAWREMLELNVLALAICTREAIFDRFGLKKIMFSLELGRRFSVDLG